MSLLIAWFIWLCVVTQLPLLHAEDSGNEEDNQLGDNLWPATTTPDHNSLLVSSPANAIPVARQLADTTPPVLTIYSVDAYISHMLVVMMLNEDGVVYCGALDDTSGAAYAPSAFQLKTGSGLDGKGQASVTGSVVALLVVSPLQPSTTYDVYCYAEDMMVNGISIADIAATKQDDIVTASGGDYVAPVITYVAPFAEIDNTAITLHVEMSEDGRVWCVLRQDLGSGTQVPAVSEVKTGSNVDSFATASVEARNLYKAQVKLSGLVEGASYEGYCFGEDMSGNGMDGSPAFPPDPNSIANSKFPYPLTTLTHLNATSLHVTSIRDEISNQYWAEPATWNLHLPSYQVHGGQRREHIESWNTPLELSGVLLNHVPARPDGCKKLPAAPFGPASVAVVRRGGCQFFEKARRAHASGHVGLLIVDSREELVFGHLPEVTANDNDPLVQIPSWIIRHGDGESLINALANGAILSLEVTDVYRKPRLGMRQKDVFGLRFYVAH